jgi:hypothetical protein
MKTVAILAALAVATEARFEDVKAYETFDANTCITSATTKAGGVYADAMTLTVPFRGEDLTLDLTADRGLFADDWKLVDNEGNVLSTDKEAFMCHYTGTVQGKKDSRVTISVCDEAGINGLIETGDFAAEIQPVDPSVSLNNLGSHIIYDMEDLVLRDDISFGEALDEFGNVAVETLTFPNVTDSDVVTNRAYVMNMVTGSDSNRMNAYSSQNAEVSNTQSVYSQMNNRYTNTNWGSGNSLRIVLQVQVVNANFGGAPTSNLSNYLPRVASWKGSNYPNNDNVQGLTSFNSGGTIGVAYLRTMCQRSNSAGINNVGFSSSTSSRGILVAHEAGHNFAMCHDNATPNNVMSSSINSNANSFSSRSVNEFLSVSSKTCL